MPVKAVHVSPEVAGAMGGRLSERFTKIRKAVAAAGAGGGAPRAQHSAAAKSVKARPTLVQSAQGRQQHAAQRSNVARELAAKKKRTGGAAAAPVSTAAVSSEVKRRRRRAHRAGAGAQAGSMDVEPRMSARPAKLARGTPSAVAGGKKAKRQRRRKGAAAAPGAAAAAHAVPSAEAVEYDLAMYKYVVDGGGGAGDDDVPHVHAHAYPLLSLRSRVSCRTGRIYIVTCRFNAGRGPHPDALRMDSQLDAYRAAAAAAAAAQPIMAAAAAPEVSMSGAE